jgi:DNA-binding transcriptional ArsR family regulator
MSIDALNWAFAIDIRPAGRKFVLVALANFADEANTCFPGQQLLAKRTGQSVRAVRAHLEALEAAGLISRCTRRRSDGSWTSDRFQLNLETMNLATGQRPELPTADSAHGENRPLQRQLSQEPAADSARHDPKEDPPSLNRSPGSKSRAKRSDEAHLKKAGECSPDFERAMSLYPPRPEGNSKPAAYRAWCARLKEGISPADLISGVERYAPYIRATGMKFILQASTFFGPDEHWKQPWAVPDPGRNGTGANPNGLANHRREPEIPSLEEELRRRRAVPR